MLHSTNVRRLFSLLLTLALFGSACGSGVEVVAGSTTSADTEAVDAGEAAAVADEPTLVPVSTATPVPTSAPAVVATESDMEEATTGDAAETREAAIERLLGEDPELDRATAECAVDVTYEETGQWEPDDPFDMVVTTMLCAIEQAFNPETMIESAMEEGYTQEEAECLVAILFDDDGAFKDMEALSPDEEIAVANEGTACADPVGPAAGSAAPGQDAELDALWESCDAGSGADCVALAAQAPLGSDYESFGVNCGGRLVLTINCGLYLDGVNSDDGGFGDFDLDDMPAPDSEPPGKDAELDALWVACGAGDGAACDELYFAAPVFSLYEQFGFTCGGRVEEELCPDYLGTPTTGDSDTDDSYADDSSGDDPYAPENVPATDAPPPGEDAELDALWVQCSAGSAQACDDLYFDSAFDSVYEVFGYTCGGRGDVNDCEALLGDEPFGEARQEAIDVIMSDRGFEASQETAECMVDGAYELTGRYEPEGSVTDDPALSDLVDSCFMTFNNDDVMDDEPEVEDE